MEKHGLVKKNDHGHSTTSRFVRGISALLPRADIHRRYRLGACFASLEKLELDCVPHHAVLIAPRLRLASLQNGNISSIRQRLSPISLTDC
jgi:hypothetical protein